MAHTAPATPPRCLSATLHPTPPRPAPRGRLGAIDRMHDQVTRVESSLEKLSRLYVAALSEDRGPEPPWLAERGRWGAGGPASSGGGGSMGGGGDRASATVHGALGRWSVGPASRVAQRGGPGRLPTPPTPGCGGAAQWAVSTDPDGGDGAEGGRSTSPPVDVSVRGRGSHPPPPPPPTHSVSSLSSSIKEEGDGAQAVRKRSFAQPASGDRRRATPTQKELNHHMDRLGLGLVSGFSPTARSPTALSPALPLHRVAHGAQAATAREALATRGGSGTPAAAGDGGAQPLSPTAATGALPPLSLPLSGPRARAVEGLGFRVQREVQAQLQAFKAELVSEIVQATAQGAAARGGGGCSAASCENPALPPDESEGAAAPSAEAGRGSRHAFGRMPIRMKSRQRPDEASGSNL